jgi:hypothetical protein
MALLGPYATEAEAIAACGTTPACGCDPSPTVDLSMTISGGCADLNGTSSLSYSDGGWTASGVGSMGASVSFGCVDNLYVLSATGICPNSSPFSLTASNSADSCCPSFSWSTSGATGSGCCGGGDIDNSISGDCSTSSDSSSSTLSMAEPQRPASSLVARMNKAEAMRRAIHKALGEKPKGCTSCGKAKK